MQKNILITGATDGIGLEAARMLAVQGHNLIIHGRNPAKLADVEKRLSAISAGGKLTTHLCDLSDLKDVEGFGAEVAENHTGLDVLINNAGVFKVRNPATIDGFDVRFVVNTITPYILTKKLLSLFTLSGRIINLSSAAQAPVDVTALAGRPRLSDSEAYAQSKLALTMWSCRMGRALKDKGPAVIAVNPASFLASKMVKEAYGVAGKNLSIGADILCRAALSHEFASASGRYFDNDSGNFSSPHPDALNDRKCETVIQTIEAVLSTS
ncbi:MAG: SDR family NAD(P)-dependent oxidoreductase [Desulfobacterales bacterium]|nr:SDR family NAD(P)-dependent oxidoreductase [Desulfobacterales bacterium]